MSADAAREPWAAVTETHTAAVFFAGDRAVKMKKALDLGFVDFRTVEARRRACELEVALNRRLAPDVYLGVGDLALPGMDEPEPVVVMRRMPSARRLSALVLLHDEPSLTEHVRAVAREVAAFHERCTVWGGDDSPGNYEQVRELWRRGLDEWAEQASDLVESSVLTQTRAYVEHYLAGRRPLFEERLATGRIRDGHGDLLADDIFLLEDGPRILDCLEFDERLRVGGVLLDAAFLAMDLERLNAPRLAHELLSAYREFSAEAHPSSLEHFYIAYRAHIRSKVACIRARQGDAAARPTAVQLAQLCASHLRAAAVHLVLVGGLPGTGKTTIASALAARRGGLHLNSDVIRKELAGLPPTQRQPEGFAEGLYAPEVTAGTYAVLLDRARVALGRGESVILDASWSDAAQRALARDLAGRTHTLLTEIMCVAPDHVAKSRLDRRRAGPSDANAAIRQRMSARFAAWPEAHVLRTHRARPGLKRLAIG